MLICEQIGPPGVGAQHWQLIYCHKPHVLPLACFFLTNFYFFLSFFIIGWIRWSLWLAFWFLCRSSQPRYQNPPNVNNCFFAINGEQLKKEDKDICLQLSLWRLMADLSYFKRGAFCEYLRNWLLVYLLTILYLKHNSKNTSIIHLLTKQ